MFKSGRVCVCETHDKCAMDHSLGIRRVTDLGSYGTLTVIVGKGLVTRVAELAMQHYIYI